MNSIRRTAIWLCPLVPLLVWSAPSLAAPPIVEKTIPAHGEIGVDPGLDRITITFDQPMSPHSRSIVGGGERFPEITGEPYWPSDRVIVVPVKLRPRHPYWFSINNPRFQGFRNLDGEPVTQYVVQFMTGPAVEEEQPLTREEIDVVVDELKETIQTGYSYADRLGIDWPQHIESNRDALRHARTAHELTQNLATLLACAQDKHVSLKYRDKLFSTYSRPTVPNVNPDLRSRIVPSWNQVNDVVATGTWDDGIGYLAIDTWSHSNAADIDAALDAINDFAESTSSLIIDVRLNGGGDETLAQKVGAWFIDEAVVYAKHVTRDPAADGGFTSPRRRVLEPRDDGARYDERVIVLSGPVVMSSCEAFLLMMRQAPNATIVGAASQGSSGRPLSHELGHGISVSVPSWKAMTPEGDEFEGVGIEPDVHVDASAREFERGDPVIRKALMLLRTADR